MSDALAEVERLRGENARLREALLEARCALIDLFDAAVVDDSSYRNERTIQGSRAITEQAIYDIDTFLLTPGEQA